jgi:hypothetical protein
VGVALGTWFGALVSGPGEGGLQLAGESSVVVESGDTVWSIARSVAGDADVRAVVDAIQSLNGLEGAHLEPGQVLRLRGCREGDVSDARRRTGRRIDTPPTATGPARCRSCVARHGKRSPTWAVDFVNPQYGRVHALWSV